MMNDNKERAVKYSGDNYDDPSVLLVTTNQRQKGFCLWAKSERRGYFLFPEIIFLLLTDIFLFLKVTSHFSQQNLHKIIFLSRNTSAFGSCPKSPLPQNLKILTICHFNMFFLWFYILRPNFCTPKSEMMQENLLWRISLMSLVTKLDNTLCAVVISAWPTVIPTYSLKTVHIISPGWTSEENLLFASMII